MSIISRHYHSASVSSEGSRLPEGSKAIKSSSVLLFAADPKKTPTEKQAPADNASATPSMLDRFKSYFSGTMNFLKRAYGVVVGGYNAVNVLLHAKQWNTLLAGANPARGIDEKTMAIADLAYISFRQGFYPSPNQETSVTGEPETPENSQAKKHSHAANFALTSQLLFQFPGLLKSYDQLPGGLTLVQDCIQSHPGLSDAEKQAKLSQLVPGKFSTLTLQGCTDALNGLLLADQS